MFIQGQRGSNLLLGLLGRVDPNVIFVWAGTINPACINIDRCSEATLVNNVIKFFKKMAMYFSRNFFKYLPPIPSQGNACPKRKDLRNLGTVEKALHGTLQKQKPVLASDISMHERFSQY